MTMQRNQWRLTVRTVPKWTNSLVLLGTLLFGTFKLQSTNGNSPHLVLDKHNVRKGSSLHDSQAILTAVSEFSDNGALA